MTLNRRGILLEIILRLLTTGSVVVGVMAVYVTIHNYTRQINAQIFLAYSDRMQSIRRSMRDDLLSTRAASEDHTENPQIPPGALETLHLIYELFELKQQGYVRKNTWLVWSKDIDRFLYAPKIRQAHDQVRKEFSGHNKFIEWIENRQAILAEHELVHEHYPLDRPIL